MRGKSSRVKGKSNRKEELKDIEKNKRKFRHLTGKELSVEATTDINKLWSLRIDAMLASSWTKIKLVDCNDFALTYLAGKLEESKYSTIKALVLKYDIKEGGEMTISKVDALTKIFRATPSIIGLEIYGMYISDSTYKPDDTIWSSDKQAKARQHLAGNPVMQRFRQFIIKQKSLVKFVCEPTLERRGDKSRPSRRSLMLISGTLINDIINENSSILISNHKNRTILAAKCKGTTSISITKTIAEPHKKFASEKRIKHFNNVISELKYIKDNGSFSNVKFDTENILTYSSISKFKYLFAVIPHLKYIAENLRISFSGEDIDAVYQIIESLYVSDFGKLNLIHKERIERGNFLNSFGIPPEIQLHILIYAGLHAVNHRRPSDTNNKLEANLASSSLSSCPSLLNSPNTNQGLKSSRSNLMDFKINLSHSHAKEKSGEMDNSRS